jgi:hypothetical protein
VSLILEYGFDVKQGELSDFQAWLSENEGRFAEACPAGVEYMGTYAAIYSSEKHAGGCRQYFRLDSYGVQDAMSATIKEGGAFASLLNDMNKFVDRDRGADWSNGLYRSMTDLGMLSDA